MNQRMNMIEREYMSLIEHKDKIIFDLEKCIRQKDECMTQIMETMKMLEEKNKRMTAPTGKVKHENTTIDLTEMEEEEWITPERLLYCQKISKGNPKCLVRHLLKGVFSRAVLAKSCANGYGRRPALPAAKLASVKKSTFSVFPDMMQRDFVHIVNQCCSDRRKKRSTTK